MEKKPQRLEEEQSLVSPGREAEIRLKTLLKVLNESLYAEQYYEILRYYNEEVTPKLRAEHLKLKEEMENGR